MKEERPWTLREKILVWGLGLALVVVAIFWIGWAIGYPPLGTDVVTVSTAATAIGTFLLAFFAWKAWQAALEAINSQKSSEQLTAMSEYIRALNALSRIRSEVPAEFLSLSTTKDFHLDRWINRGRWKYHADSLCHPVEAAGSIWRAHHGQSKWMRAAFRDSEQIIVEAQEWWHVPREGTEERRNVQFERTAEFAKQIVSLVAAWQVSPGDRHDLSALLDAECAKFIEESPCRPMTG